jgi:hypothetical protein
MYLVPSCSNQSIVKLRRAMMFSELGNAASWGYAACACVDFGVVGSTEHARRSRQQSDARSQARSMQVHSEQC